MAVTLPENDLPLDGRIVGKCIHVHSEDSSDEGQRQEDECDPTQAPETFIELQRVARIPDGDSFVYLPEWFWLEFLRARHGEGGEKG